MNFLWRHHICLLTANFIFSFSGLSIYLAWGGDAVCGCTPFPGSTGCAQHCQLCHAVFCTHLRPALSIYL